MFFKFWAIGNGGRKCYKFTKFFYYYNSEQDIEDEGAENIFIAKFGSMPYSIRSFYWEIIENPSNELIQNEIENYKNKIKESKSIIKILEKLK